MSIILNPVVDTTFKRAVEGSWKPEASPLSPEQVARRQVRAGPIGKIRELLLVSNTNSSSKLRHTHS